MKKLLKQIVEDNTTRRGKIFDYSIQFLIILSLIAFSLETLPNKSELFIQTLNTIEVFCVIIFSIEYVLRIFVADKPLRYIFSFFGLIDLIAILPFYLNVAFDLRSLRAFRIFRIFRALKLVRYNRAMRRFQIAARIVKEEIILFFMVASILIFLSAAGIYFFENEAQPERFSSIFDSLWWAIVTLTTVGYGDVFPVTIGGKVFTFFVLIIGVGIVTLPAGIMATALTKARTIEEKEAHEQK